MDHFHVWICVTRGKTSLSLSSKIKTLLFFLSSPSNYMCVCVIFFFCVLSFCPVLTFYFGAHRPPPRERERASSLSSLPLPWAICCWFFFYHSARAETARLPNLLNGPSLLPPPPHVSSARYTSKCTRGRRRRASLSPGRSLSGSPARYKRTHTHTKLSIYICVYHRRQCGHRTSIDKRITKQKKTVKNFFSQK